MSRRTLRRAVLAAMACAPSLLVLAAAELPAPTPAVPSIRPAPAEGIWLRVDTDDFSIVGQVPEARLRMIGRRLEAYRAALEWLHPGARSSPRETSVYVFRDAASGRPYSPPLAGAGQHLGVNPPYDVPNYVTVAAPVDDTPLDLLYHAYAHQFLDDNFARLPLTVTEGLAEFYSGFTITPQESLIGVARAEHVRWLKGHAALPLSRQFSLDAGDPFLADAPGRAAFMAGSWALMHYLVAGGDGNRAGLPVLLGALQCGTPPDEAVLKSYGVSLDRLQQEVGHYVERNRFQPILVGQETPGLAPPPDAPDGPKAPGAPPSPAMPAAPGVRLAPEAGAGPARRLGRDEVLALLGELLAHAGQERAADAEAHFQEALRLNPSQARAHAGLGYLRYAQNRFTDAVPSLERAIEIDPDAMSCYLLARSLLRINEAAARAAPATAGSGTPPWRARVRSLLARAIELRPRFAAPYVTLGATHIGPDGNVEAGIELLQKARAMLPARMDIAGNLVYLFLRKGDFVRAQTLVDTVLANGGDPEALRAARQDVAAFWEHVQARQSLYATRPTPEEAARQEQARAEAEKRLREILATTKNPETRAQIEKMLQPTQAMPLGLDYNVAVGVFNDAVERANQRDYGQAIALLEGLLPKVKDPELIDRIKTMLERFRQDAARIQQTVR